MPVESNAVPLGVPAPRFRLPEPLTGREVAFDDFPEAKAVLVAFIANHCPAVKLIREAFNQYARDYAARGVQVIAINANAPEVKAGEDAAAVAEEARAQGYVFPYLRDETQAVAKAYDAASTPDLYLYDRDRKLYYHGRFDAARPRGDIPVTGDELRAATDLLLAGALPPSVQHNAVGCSIKWRDVQAAPQVAGAPLSAAA